MKQRAGFVSNSSSASFVLVGFDVDPTAKDANIAKLRAHFGLPEAGEDSDGLWDEDLFNAMDQARVRYMRDTESGSPSNTRHVIGVVISEVHSDGGYAEPTETPCTELMYKAGDLANAFEIYWQDIKLHTGSRMA